MRDKRVSRKTRSSVIGVKREMKGGLRGGLQDRKRYGDEDGEGGGGEGGGVNREERDHTQHSNPAIDAGSPSLSSFLVLHKRVSPTSR